MFGCTAVYIGEKIMLALRDKPTAQSDNGVWLATTTEHRVSLRREFPNIRHSDLDGELGRNMEIQLIPKNR